MEKGSILKTENQLLLENEQLRSRLTETEEALNAIRNGEVDAIVVSGPDGEKVFSLTSAETPYRIIVEEMNEGAVSVSADGTILYCNHRFSELVSIPLEQIIGSNFARFVAKSEKPAFDLLMQAGKMGKCSGEITYLMKDRNARYFQLAFSALTFNAVGEVCIIVSDITELKEKEEDLLRSHDTMEQLVAVRTAELKKTIDELDTSNTSIKKMMDTTLEDKNALEIANRKLIEEIAEHKKSEEELSYKTEELNNYFTYALDLFCIADTDGYFRRLNKQWELTLGYSLKELEGSRFLDLVHPDDLNDTLDALSKLDSQKEVLSFSNRYRCKDGTYRWIDWRSYPIGKLIYAAARDITERKLVEGRLQESEEKYRNLVDNSIIGVYQITMEGDLIFGNEAMLKIVEYDGDDYTQLNVKECYKNPADRDKLTHILKENGEIRNFETKLISFKGNTIDVIVNARTNGDILSGSMMDITERKLMEDALENSLSITEATLESIHNGILVVSQQGKIIKNNAKFAEMWCIPSDVLASRDDKILLDYVLGQLADPDEFIAKVSELYEQPEVESFDLIYFKDGRIFERVSKPMYLGGKPKGRVWSFLDITSSKQAEKALRQSEERLRDIIFSIGDWVWEVDENSVYTYSSKKGFELFGSSREEVIGKKPFDFMPPDEATRVAAIFSEIAIKKAPIKDLENWNIRKNGEKIFLLTNGVPILDNAGNLKGYRGVDKDITRRKQAEEELVRAKYKAEESDRLKSAFLANMSHEIRTPLNAIVGFSGLFSDPDLNQEDKIHYSEIIKSRSDDLLYLINDILELSRIESGNSVIMKEHVVVNDILDELEVDFRQKLLQMMKSNLRLVCEKTLSVDQSRIISDGRIIKQVFSNLIDNASKFTESGTIRFGYKLPENHMLTCFVSDTGIGISPENLEVIFENFRQAVIENPQKLYGGTGLGLSICKGSLALLGGKIWVESVPGLGSTFYFTIPFEQSPAPKMKPVPKPEEIPAKVAYNWAGKKLLLLEDDESNIEFLKLILEKTHAELVYARNGREFRALYGSLETFDLVLIDVRLPDANGWELAREIKSIRADLPVVAQTAYAMESDRQKSKEAGCDDYISKPIKKHELTELIQKHFNKNKDPQVGSILR